MSTFADTSKGEASLRSDQLPPPTPRRGGLDAIFGDAFIGGIPPLSPRLFTTGDILTTPRGPGPGFSLPSPTLSTGWLPQLSPRISASASVPSDATNTLGSANAQARTLAQSILASLNDSMHTSTKSQASPLLSLLYSPKVHFTSSTVSAVTAEEQVLHDVATLADCIGVLADIGLLGAKFDDFTHFRCDYVPAKICVQVAGTVHLATGKSMSYWRQLNFIWGSNGMSSPRTVSPTDWRVCDDNLMFFP